MKEHHPWCNARDLQIELQQRVERYRSEHFLFADADSNEESP